MKKSQKTLTSYSKENDAGETYLDVHKLHPYPAKFHPKVPREAIKKYTDSGDYVLDPFCGCGTTLVESKILRRDSVGTDINPLAVFISNVKTTPIEDEELKKIKKHLNEIERNITTLYNESLLEDETITYQIPDFYNRDHWFQQNVQNELAIIINYLNEIEDEKIKNFLKFALSSIIVKVSNQESDTRYAAVEKNIKNKQTFSEFKKAINSMLPSIKKFSSEAKPVKAKAHKKDARNIDFLEDESIDLVVTSPPYANTYDYYLYHKMRMYWLGMDVKEAQEREMGSRQKYSSQKKDPKNFFQNIGDCLKEMERVLKPNKNAVIVIGDSVISGELFKMDKKIEEMVTKLELNIKDIKHTNLGDYTSFNRSFRNNNKEEYIIELRKE